MRDVMGYLADCQSCKTQATSFSPRPLALLRARAHGQDTLSRSAERVRDGLSLPRWVRVGFGPADAHFRPPGSMVW